MAKIKKIKGRQVFDSRGNPTVEAEVFLKDGHFASAIVPSGASTGTYEAFELRDKNNKNYLGKSVLKAVENINGPIKKALNNIDIYDQKKIDKTLIDLDDTEQKKKLGANAILAVSIASCKLAAIEKNTPLYKYLGNSKSYQLPIPLLNIINGGVHAKNNLDIQEFMIRPEKVKSFSEAIRRSFLVIQNLKGMVDNTNVGDEGGFAPNLTNNEEAIKIIKQSWTSKERFSFEGKYWQFDDIIVEPVPIQKPYPPLWSAAGSDQSISGVAAAGFNVLFDHFASFERTKQRLEVWKEACKNNERELDPDQIILARGLTITLSDQEYDKAVSRREERVSKLFARFGTLPGIKNERPNSYSDKGLELERRLS